MSRKFSLAHLTALKCPTPELVYIAAMAGYDYVSPRVVNMGLLGEGNYDLSAQPRLLEQTQQALATTGVQVHDIELLRVLEDKEIADYEPAMEVAAKLGAKNLLTSIWTPKEEVYLAKFAQLCDLAAKYGLYVSLEFVTWADVSDLNQAAHVLRTVNRNNARLMVDTLHAHRSRVAPQELESCPKEWFAFCHICDGPKVIPTDRQEMISVGRDARLYCGEGGVDIASYLEKMPRDLVCSIELPHLQRAAEFGYAEHVRRCLQTAKDYLAAHQL